MAPRSTDRDPIGGIALLGDLDGVETAAGDGHGHAAAFVDGARRAEPLGSMVDDPLGARRPAGLLVRGAGEQHVATKARDRVAGRVEAVVAGPVRQQSDDAELERHHALHVDGATPVDVAVGQVGRERIVRPALGWRRDHVEMGQEQERIPAGPVAAKAGVDRAAAGDRLDDLRCQARVPQEAGDVPGRDQLAVRGLGGRRVDRTDPDQVPEGLDGRAWAASQVVPSSSRDGAVASRRHAAPASRTLRTTPMMNPPRISPATMARSKRP